MVKASQAMSISALAASLNIAGTQRQKIAGSHAINADGAAAVTASKLKLEAQEKITFKCGQSEVVIGSDGVSFKGLDVTIEGSSKLEMPPPAIKTP
jgi:hypothetical protein